MTTESKYRGEGGEGERCGEILDLLSVSLARTLPARDRIRVDRHLEWCGDCESDLRFMTRVFSVRPNPPSGLADSVMARLHMQAVPRSTNWWSASVAAAAVLVLAMGMGLATQAIDSSGDFIEWELAAEGEAYDWAAEDWFVAGAPHLEGVSDATLLALLSDEDFQ